MEGFVQGVRLSPNDLGRARISPISARSLVTISRVLTESLPPGSANSRHRSSFMSSRKRARAIADAETDLERSHSVSAKSIPIKRQRPPSPPKYQDVFAQALIELANENQNVVAITAAMPTGTSLNKFAKGASRSLLRCRNRRAARGDICRGSGDAGHPAGSVRSIRPSCNAPTIRSSTMSACSACQSCLHSIGPVLPVMMANTSR